jgi:hypothetical protein
VCLVVLDRLIQAHLDTAERVDDGGEPAEPDLDVVVDGNAGGVLQCLYEQRRTAEGKGRVDPLFAVPGDLDHRIAWHADESRPAVSRDV